MTRRFSASLRRGGRRKTDNAPTAKRAKIQIRRNVLDGVGATSASVFDAFAGSGDMFRSVWSDANRYVGCDLVWYRGERQAYVADNRRVLRCIDLYQFNIFDFDAHGSPWHQCVILAARRKVEPGEKLGLVLTEGSGLKIKLGGYPEALRLLAGIRRGAAGGSRSQDELNDRAIASMCRRMNAKVVRRWGAQKKAGALMRYIGLILEG